jgi:hypothetical protein
VAKEGYKEHNVNSCSSYSRKRGPNEKDTKIQNKDYYGKWQQEAIHHTTVLYVMQ